MFLKAFGPIVVGKKKWRKNCTSKELSKFFTSADEAFLHLCYHTYYKKWISIAYNGNNNNENYNKIVENNNEDDEDSEDDNINYDAIFKSWLTQDGKGKNGCQLKGLKCTTTCLQKLF